MLMVLGLAVYLPGLRAIPPVDRDESRFAQASRTMLESGHFVIPRIQDKPRLNKPPLIYWLQSGSAKLLGDAPGPDGLGEWGNGNIWVFRFPSVLCAIGTVLLTWRLGLRLFDSRAALLAATLLAVCPMIVWDAHQARADQLMVLTVMGAMFALYVCWKQTQRVSGVTGVARAARPPVVKLMWPCIFWLWIALGILAKGPVTPMIALLAIITLSIATRSARWTLQLRPLLGLLIIAALVGPWVWLVSRAVGWSTYWPIILKETIGRSTDAAESHWGPPGYHTVLLAVLFWPGSLLTLAAVIRACRAFPWHERPAGVFARRSAELFLLAWLIPSWIVFECIATKLPHYTMPLYPAIALLTARAACAAMTPSSKLLRTAFDRMGVLFWCGIGVTGLLGSLGALTEWGGYDFSPSTFGRLPLVAAAWVMLGCIAAACVAIDRERAVARAHVLAICAVLVWCWVSLACVLPRSRDLWISPQLAAIVSRVQASAPTPVALIGYQEDSAIFMLRGRAERIEPAHLADWIVRHPTGLVAIEPARAPDAAKVAAASLTRVSTIDGYNYSIGKRATIEVYAPRPRPISNP